MIHGNMGLPNLAHCLQQSLITFITNEKTHIASSHVAILENKSSWPLQKNVFIMITWPVNIFFLAVPLNQDSIPSKWTHRQNIK